MVSTPCDLMYSSRNLYYSIGVNHVTNLQKLKTFNIKIKLVQVTRFDTKFIILSISTSSSVYSSDPQVKCESLE